MAPGTSLLFLNTSKLAPESRCPSQPRFNSISPRRPGPANLFQQQPRQLLPAVVDPLAVCCVDNPHERVRLFKVVFPVRSQRLLSADVPCLVSLCCCCCCCWGQYICSVCIFHHQPLPLVTSVSRTTHPSYSIVLIIKPSVGLTLLTSSPMIFFTIVVFPALSKPLVPSAFSRSLLSFRAPTASKSASPCPSDALFVKSTALLLLVAVLPSGDHLVRAPLGCWPCRVNFAAMSTPPLAQHPQHPQHSPRDRVTWSLLTCRQYCSWNVRSEGLYVSRLGDPNCIDRSLSALYYPICCLPFAT
jgi:hypothetical protein